MEAMGGLVQPRRRASCLLLAPLHRGRNWRRISCIQQHVLNTGPELREWVVARVALLEHLGLGADAVRLAKAKAIDAIPGRCKGFKPPSTPTTWAALRGEDARLAAEVREQAARYGYDPDDASAGCDAPAGEARRRELRDSGPATRPPLAHA